MPGKDNITPVMDSLSSLYIYLSPPSPPHPLDPPRIVNSSEPGRGRRGRERERERERATERERERESARAREKETEREREREREREDADLYGGWLSYSSPIAMDGVSDHPATEFPAMVAE